MLNILPLKAAGPLAALGLLLAARPAAAQVPANDPQAAKILLPNGWSLTPAGTSLHLGDLPLNMQLAPGGRLLAVSNNGQSKQAVQLIDPGTEKIVAQQAIKSRGTGWPGARPATGSTYRAATTISSWLTP